MWTITGSEAVWELAPLTQGLAIPHSHVSGIRGWAVMLTLSSPAMIVHIHPDGHIQRPFRTRVRSRFAHLFIDSTYVPGMGLDTKTMAGTVELKFIFSQ